MKTALRKAAAGVTGGLVGKTLWHAQQGNQERYKEDDGGSRFDCAAHARAARLRGSRQSALAPSREMDSSAYNSHMLFSWLRKRRRRKLLAQPFPIRWEPFLHGNVAHYERLAPAEQSRLRDITRILIAEKTWEGAHGLFVTEEMKVTIAAQAALLLLGLDHEYYARVDSIVVYPGPFRTPAYEGEWVDEELSDLPVEGEAIYRGPVLLSWSDVLPEGRHPDNGFNVVVHEFAHQLDFLDNAINGTPPLDDRELEARWTYVMTVALEDHRRAIRKGAEAFFSQQAADNETEFFADASEAFFCRPLDMKDQYPEVYQLFEAFYRVDPAKWFSQAG